MTTPQNKAFAAVPTLQITQQEDWRFELGFSSDQSAHEFYAQIRPSFSSEVVHDIDIDTTDAAAEPPRIALSQSGEVTADMAPGVWVLDVWRVSTDGTRMPVAFRRVEVNAAVTELADEEV